MARTKIQVPALTQRKSSRGLIRAHSVFALSLAVLLFSWLAPAQTAIAQVLPATLKGVPVPRPSNLGDFVRLDALGNPVPEAIQLGKALFWDMQLGSDGVQACASCHFHAGADSRTVNQVSPGLLGRDNIFHLEGPNDSLTAAHFPFRKLVDPDNRGTGGVDPNDPAVISDVNDVSSSQGVHFSEFADIVPGSAVDRNRLAKEGTFKRNRLNTRRVEPRNTPTVINAVFNLTNFWDGRANRFFNGVNPFGNQDVNARILAVNEGTGAVQEEAVLLDNSSLASQAVGPPLSEFEMSAAGRTFAKIGKKILRLGPLAKQVVHPNDSVLGPLANSRATPGAPGINTTYADLIRAVFLPRYWDSAKIAIFTVRPEYHHTPTVNDPDGYMLRNGDVIIQDPPGRPLATDEFTLMEANFSLFFGLAIQMYEATLVSDDTPFDRFLDPNNPNAPNEMSLAAQGGFSDFTGQAGCIACHFGPEFTGASVGQAANPLEPGMIEVMPMADGLPARYDVGFYNIGVRPIAEDLGRGGPDPFGNPLSFSRQSGIVSGLLPGALTFDPATVPQPGCLPDPFAIPVPIICPSDLNAVNKFNDQGVFKTPGLRNVELTGPYFHNGGMLTLSQVVHFYVRGGDFHEANFSNLDPFIIDLNGMKGSDRKEERDEMVAFLLALTDERVRLEMAPFDHPQLFVANGHTNQRRGNPKRLRKIAGMFDNLVEIPAVGAGGRPASGLPSLKPFLAGDLTGTALSNFHFQE